MVGVRVEVQFACGGESVPAARDIRRWVRAALAAATAGGSPEVSVRIIDADESQRLNREFRGIDRPTNVLSFPCAPLAGLPPGEPRPLGDIAVCGAVVAREAAEQGKALRDHWAHMLVHGALHLLGFDHGTASEAREMETLETRVLAALDIDDPYRVK